MVLNYIWISFFIIAFLVALAKTMMGDLDIFSLVVNSIFERAELGFKLSIGLTGIMALWLGIMRIGEKGGAIHVLSKIFAPLFRKLFPEIPSSSNAHGSIIMNISANMLGLDNAATPLGLKAMNELQKHNPEKEKGVCLDEFVQDGVVRGLKSRDGWAAQWDAQMRAAPNPTPERLYPVAGLGSAGIVRAGAFGLMPHDVSDLGFGHQAAVDTLEEFLTHRGERYQAEMSSPLTAETACSRMSPFIAYGILSRRTIFQRFEARRAEVRAGRKAKTGISADWSRAMASFNKRLHWNGHFIQRLELQPELEFTNMSRAMDGLR